MSPQQLEEPPRIQTPNGDSRSDGKSLVMLAVYPVYRLAISFGRSLGEIADGVRSMLGSDPVALAAQRHAKHEEKIYRFERKHFPTHAASPEYFTMQLNSEKPLTPTRRLEIADALYATETRGLGLPEELKSKLDAVLGSAKFAVADVVQASPSSASRSTPRQNGR